MVTNSSFCRKTTLTKHVRRQHGGRPRSTDGEESDEEGMEQYEMQQASRSMRHSSSSTVPSQDLNIHFSKRTPHPHHIHHHPQHHLAVNNGVRHHHPQAVYLSPNPSSAGPQAPPMYYPSTHNGGYPHTPNSMVHRENEEDYENAAGADALNGEVNPYHRMQMQQPKYQYHPHNPAGSFSHPNADPVAYYSPNLPTPAVSPASSCSGPNLPPPTQYAQNTGHHSPSSTHASTASHQPTPYQAPHPPNPHHPQPIHYAAAYSGHRLYNLNEGDQSNQSYVPRMHTYPSSQNMPISSEGTHGLGISMNQSMKVEVSTPMGTAW